ncbi:lysozyme inhibitor LprI family protein [Ruegeria atlantica]|uniref:lysozyme inhibitor LprI family protein n=1 Tax=Ruegeria atlantica TaxID=81569 RepID=UPI00147E452B|nr:lysozyme inhibitor LprI family protein [Ruegeria atlantica]
MLNKLHSFDLLTLGTVSVLTFVLPQDLWAQNYQVQDEHGQTTVDQAYMDAQVRGCVESAGAPTDLSDCIGAFSGDCMNEDISWGQSTLGIYFCVEAETAVWDTLVDESAADLLVHYNMLDEGDAEKASSLPFRVPSLTEAQERWEEMREADCLVEYLQWRGGTGAKLLGAGCRLERTSQRVVWLKTLLEER